jgi:hypothetical protein
LDKTECPPLLAAISTFGWSKLDWNDLLLGRRSARGDFFNTKSEIRGENVRNARGDLFNTKSEKKEEKM